jgi:hypothetical protein
MTTDHLEPPTEPGRSRRTTSSARPVTELWVRCWVRCHIGGPGSGEAGQSTVEYALVLLGAAAVALAVVAWVTRTDAVSRLFDAVVGRILSQAG